MSRSKAKKLYEEFHKYSPNEITRASPSFRVPSRASFAGPALYVLYRSEKLDPITYAVPGAPQNYIHEHKAGVKVYWCEGQGTKVPREICSSNLSLTCLGESLGFGYVDDDDDEVEVEFDSRVELYSTPYKRGHALLIIEDQRRVIAMVWGGNLRVEPRGIVG